MRERLIELLKNWLTESAVDVMEGAADYLLQNGVVVLTRDGNDFNSDFYCPYCGNNLSAREEKKNGGN